MATKCPALASSHGEVTAETAGASTADTVAEGVDRTSDGKATDGSENVLAMLAGVGAAESESGTGGKKTRGDL